MAIDPITHLIVLDNVGEALVSVTDPASFVLVKEPLKDGTYVEDSSITLYGANDLSVITVGMVGPSGAPAQVIECLLTAALIQTNEIEPGIVKIPILNSQNLTRAISITGYMDGQFTPQGEGWQVGRDGLSIEVYVPPDPFTRDLYTNANIRFSLTVSF